ncbi:MAG: glutamate-5-semialdehyde dehydrogenase [Sphaerochaetaceae bacterium]|nr:glutamate-5-semialdehyde dehydrogenase [Spirochaetales bacterium]MDY5498763.1 glutamate-5-semialdehyde dehydrogenase [Sphaerochaetaceae bacterium]
MTIREQMHQVKEQSKRLASASLDERDDLLARIREGLVRDWSEIASANAEDLARAEAEALKPALKARLVFDEEKRKAVSMGIDDIIALPDPMGKVLEKRELDVGLVLSRVSVPLGVIGMVFEARPDALVQIVSLAVKSGNGIILKGGSEALSTNRALARSIVRSCQGTRVGAGWILLLENREEVSVMLTARNDIDLIIPRGSNAFVSYVMEHTDIPVLGHSSGICHLYVESDADFKMACAIAVDAKTNAPSACNSIETLLVNRQVAPAFIPMVAKALRGKGVVLHGDAECAALVPDVVPCRNGDWDTEYLASELNIHVVGSLQEAVEHINRHGSHHTDAIVTNDPEKGRMFQQQVDSADVFVNASTRFADGYRFGLGAEVGISTSKIHARGPVGLMGLMTSKWLLDGSGQVVSTYMGPHARPFTHKELV